MREFRKSDRKNVDELIKPILNLDIINDYKDGC